ncbi:hypothetical protein A2635_03070 [Candidatus Peribacteria bacterium RIFCSPHIGHO2_01_FULL_51_9]|nr:MAG: hypothetical protein A2635_03070 [Candidatus Peribacteria bacterium RIFCSPHIGHO2_01_FULL_51_9]
MTIDASILPHWPLDWLVLGLFAATVAIDAMRGGTRRAATLSLAAPLAAMLYLNLANTAWIGTSLTSLQFPGAKAALFAAIFVLLFILIYRIVPSAFGSGSFPLQAILAALSATIILAVVWQEVPALVALYPVSPWVHTLFGAPHSLYWLVGSYLALAFARR